MSGATLTLDTIRTAMEAMRKLAAPPRLPTYVLVSGHASTGADELIVIDWTKLGADWLLTHAPTWEAVATPRAMIRLARALRAASCPNPRRIWKRHGTALYLLRNARSIPEMG